MLKSEQNLLVSRILKSNLKVFATKKELEDAGRGNGEIYLTQEQIDKVVAEAIGGINQGGGAQVPLTDISALGTFLGVYDKVEDIPTKDVLNQDVKDLDFALIRATWYIREKGVWVSISKETILPTQEELDLALQKDKK